MTMDETTMTPMQRKLFSHLRSGRDVTISKLHHALYGTSTVTPTRQQQQLGPHIGRLNARLEPQGFRVRPGVARGSYRLYPIQAPAA